MTSEILDKPSASLYSIGIVKDSMQDNYLNQDSIVALASDNISGEHYQKVKIVWAQNV